VPGFLRFCCCRSKSATVSPLPAPTLREFGGFLAEISKTVGYVATLHRPRRSIRRGGLPIHKKTLSRVCTHTNLGNCMKLWLALLFTFSVGMGSGYAIWYNTSPCTISFEIPELGPTTETKVET